MFRFSQDLMVVDCHSILVVFIGIVLILHFHLFIALA